MVGFYKYCGYVASLSGRPMCCHAAITALRPVACTVLSMSRPCRDALGAVILL